MSEKHSIVIEEYLLLLYQLRGAGERLKAVTLAQRLKSSAPTVHATPQRMQRDDLIQMDDKKEINLTKEGERLACDIAFRHNLAEYFLCNTLGIPWYEVHKHAHQLEHAMTPTVSISWPPFSIIQRPALTGRRCLVILCQRTVSPWIRLKKA